MKKTIATLALMIACQGIFAQSTDDLFKEFGKETKAESVSISPFMMSFGRFFMDNDIPTIAKRIRSMKVLDLGDCSESVKKKFTKRTNNLRLEGYEPMIQVNEDGEKIRIFALPHKESIKELLFICNGKDDCSLIQMKGDIRREDIAELVNEQTRKD